MNSELNILDMIKPEKQKAQSERKVWSIPVSLVASLGKAANIKGITNIPKVDLAYPVQLSRDQDDNIRFNAKTGKPILRTAKSLSTLVKGIRESLIESIASQVESVKSENETVWNEYTSECVKLGDVAKARDESDLAVATNNPDVKS